MTDPTARPPRADPPTSASAGLDAPPPTGPDTPSPSGPEAAPPSGPDAPTAAGPAPPRRLARSRDDRVLGGVAAGLARYLDVDPAIVRVAFVVLTLAGGSGVLAYLVAWVLIPEEPADGSPHDAGPTRDPAAMRFVAGAVLVALGLSWLLEAVLPDIGRIAWPVALIAVGVLVVVGGVRR